MAHDTYSVCMDFHTWYMVNGTIHKTEVSTDKHNKLKCKTEKDGLNGIEMKSE